MAPNWDEDSPQLRRNLDGIQQEIVRTASQRQKPTAGMAKQWHAAVMKGLRADDSKYVGAFRGEPGVEGIGARIGHNVGAHSTNVKEELRRFEEVLQAVVSKLDRDLPVGKELDAEEQANVISLCAWAHAEWVRIHPFVNGNGRTARLWANFLATRCGLPPFVRLRPRPDDGYEEAGVKAMQGDWKATVLAFGHLWNRFWEESRD